MFFENPILTYLESAKTKPVEILCIDEKPLVDVKDSSTQTEKEYTNLSIWGTKYGKYIILGLLLPLSMLLEVYSEVTDWIHRQFLSNPNMHPKRLEYIKDKVKQWNENGLRGKCFIDLKPSENMIPKTSIQNGSLNIECSFNDILFLDKEKSIVKTEPFVKMRYINSYLIPKGYQLSGNLFTEEAMIAELCTETKYDCFHFIHEMIESFDFITANGELLHVSRNNNSELFYTVPGSYGTLGFIVAIELRIVPIKPYVYVNYLPCYNQDELYETMKELTELNNPPDFLEAIVYSQKESVISFCYFRDANLMADWDKMNFVNSFWKPWYSLHMRSALKNGSFSEYIPIRHFKHRFTKSIPYLYDYRSEFLKSSLMKKIVTPSIQRVLVSNVTEQDVIIPIDRMKEVTDKFHESFGIYPFFILPVAVCEPFPHEGIIPNSFQKITGKCSSVYIRMTLSGIPQKIRNEKFWDAEKVISEMETYIKGINGYIGLHVDSIVKGDDFLKISNHKTYDKLREEYNCIGAFPELYEKMKSVRI